MAMPLVLCLTEKQEKVARMLFCELVALRHLPPRLVGSPCLHVVLLVLTFFILVPHSMTRDFLLPFQIIMATKPPPHLDANDIALSREKRKKNRHLPLDALDALAAVAVHAQNVANAEQPTCSLTIKSNHGENTLTSCISDPNGCTLCQTASHNPPNPPETPGPVLGQVCIDHIVNIFTR